MSDEVSEHFPLPWAAAKCLHQLLEMVTIHKNLVSSPGHLGPTRDIAVLGHKSFLNYRETGKNMVLLNQQLSFSKPELMFCWLF